MGTFRPFFGFVEERMIKLYRGRLAQLAHSRSLRWIPQWMGVEIWQWPPDMFAIQELLLKTRPDFVVETGTARGGSAIFYSSIFELLGNGTVISIDLHNTKARKTIENHFLGKRIVLIEGDSKSEQVLHEVQRIVGQSSTNVFLDSDHSTSHVLAELRNFSKLVKVGNYIVVFDTYTSLLQRGGRRKYNRYNNPLVAIRRFLLENGDFVIDRHYEKYLLTLCENGFLKRVR